MKKSLDTKLADIRSNPNSDAFIIAYAADPDMSKGIATLTDATPSIQAYYDDLVDITEQAKIDVLLTSVSTMDVLAHEKRLFDTSPVTPAVRANDTTDLWDATGAGYTSLPSRPFASPTIEEAQYGTLLPKPDQKPDIDLGLYSITFNNNLDTDWLSLMQFKAFRTEATRKGFRYFLEVFNPNVADCGLSAEDIPKYVNDQIARMLAGIPRASRPEFLKIAYNGPEAMEALVNYDSTVVVGILGGPTSTTYDSFKLISEAKKHGARVALFGRRIKGAENPRAFVEVLRDIADGLISPEEGVKIYHNALNKLGIAPLRNFEEDMVLFTSGLV
ncbi:MAG: hypothetical protein OXH16_22145 [Gemmatimonadetes bacterium]|nr:hypothetical protein [Gemmatimonadota bacterium]